MQGYFIWAELEGYFWRIFSCDEALNFYKTFAVGPAVLLMKWFVLLRLLLALWYQTVWEMSQLFLKKKALFSSWCLVKRGEFIWFRKKSKSFQILFLYYFIILYYFYLFFIFWHKSKCQNPSRNATLVLPTAVTETNWKYNFPKICLYFKFTFWRGETGGTEPSRFIWIRKSLSHTGMCEISVPGSCFGHFCEERLIVDCPKYSTVE